MILFKRQLASGSGDTTVRFWDLETETPLHTCKAHTNWVLCVAWSFDGLKLASADKNSQVLFFSIHVYLFFLNFKQIQRFVFGILRLVNRSDEPY